ncbi:ATP-binding protein [Kitasatospora terrestris]
MFTTDTTTDRTGAVGAQPGRTRTAEYSMAATAVAVSGFRNFARDTAARWMISPDDTGLALVVSELVGNAVRHSGSADVSLLLSATVTTLTVEVRDSGRWRRPSAPVTDGLACGGRGLDIVEACATRTTVHRTLAGTRVIAVLPLG